MPALEAEAWLRASTDANHCRRNHPFPIRLFADRYRNGPAYPSRYRGREPRLPRYRLADRRHGAGAVGGPDDLANRGCGGASGADRLWISPFFGGEQPIFRAKTIALSFDGMRINR